MRRMLVGLCAAGLTLAALGPPAAPGAGALPRRAGAPAPAAAGRPAQVYRYTEPQAAWLLAAYLQQRRSRIRVAGVQIRPDGVRVSGAVRLRGGVQLAVVAAGVPAVAGGTLTFTLTDLRVAGVPPAVAAAWAARRLPPGVVVHGTQVRAPASLVPPGWLPGGGRALRLGLGAGYVDVLVQ